MNELNEPKVKHMIHEELYGCSFRTSVDNQIAKNTSGLCDIKLFISVCGMIILLVSILGAITTIKLCNLSRKVTELETRVHTLEEVVEYGGLDSER